MAHPVIATNFQADANYGAGTAVQFGGNNEVTLATQQTTSIAGIVVADAQLLLNNTFTGPNVVAVATQGRVMCSIVGTAQQGDLITAGSGGFVQSIGQIYYNPDVASGPSVGCVVGRAVSNSANGQVEVQLNLG